MRFEFIEKKILYIYFFCLNVDYCIRNCVFFEFLLFLVDLFNFVILIVMIYRLFLVIYIYSLWIFFFDWRLVVFY